MLPNRIALYLTGLGNLVAGVAPFVFDYAGDPAKAAAYVTSILGVNAVVITWLRGWQKWEERTDLGLPGVVPADPGAIAADEGDAKSK